MQAQRIDPLGPVPPYRQIAAIIKRGIQSGKYPPNARIPTESELVETYEVARSTARRAIAVLREEGLVGWFEHHIRLTRKRQRARRDALLGALRVLLPEAGSRACPRACTC